MDRRSFFKTAGAAAATATAACPAAARSTRTLPPDAVGLLFDSTLCIGCKACVAACKESNGMPPEVSTPDALWDTPKDISGKTLTVIKVYRDGKMEKKDSVTDGYAFVKKSCMHCVDPSVHGGCADRVAAWGAMER